MPGHDRYKARTAETPYIEDVQYATYEHTIGSAEIQQNIAIAVSDILAHIDDPCREGLLRTPDRVARYYQEFLSPPELRFTTFANDGQDEMVVQSNIPFYSLCEHHLLPFMGTAAIAYIPGDRIVGLSKLARTVDFFSRRLQNQERIGTQIADLLVENLDTDDVAVILRARHMCMEMRGVQKHDTYTTTSTLRGAFRKTEVRAELLQLLK